MNTTRPLTGAGTCSANPKATIRMVPRTLGLHPTGPQIPDNDIIVEANQSTTISFDRSAVEAAVAPDVVISFATSDSYLQPRFQTLSDRVVSDWSDRFGDVKLRYGSA